MFSRKKVRVVLFKFSLAWRNLLQRRSQFVTALAAIAFAVFLMFSQLGFQNAMLNSNVAFIQVLNADLIMLSQRRYVTVIDETFNRTRLYQARQFEGVAAAYPLYITLGSWRRSGTAEERSIRVLGFNLDDPVFLLPEIQAAESVLKMPNTVLTDSRSRKDYGSMQPGVTTELSGVNIKIIGTFELGADFVTDGNLIISDLNFLRIFATRPSGIDSKLRSSLNDVDIGLIKVTPGTNSDRLEKFLNQALPSDIVVYTKQHFIAKELNYWMQASGIGAIFGLGTIIGFVVGIVVVYNIIYSNVADNLPQYGTLKAIGYSNFYLVSIVFLQSIILSFFGFFPGLCLSSIFYQLISTATGLQLEMDLNVISLVLFLTVLMCVISGLIASRKLKKIDPADIY
ncbi:ABC transporter permease DevC [Nostoc sp. DSM 114159]|jgi:putative ABC transport system permease protein